MELEKVKRRADKMIKGMEKRVVYESPLKLLHFFRRTCTEV